MQTNFLLIHPNQFLHLKISKTTTNSLKIHPYPMYLCIVNNRQIDF